MRYCSEIKRGLFTNRHVFVSSDIERNGLFVFHQNKKRRHEKGGSHLNETKGNRILKSGDVHLGVSST